MSKIKQFLKNISPLNNRTDMPVMLYIIKVIIIFWFVKFGAELIGEGIVMATLFVCGKNPLQGEMFDPDIMVLIMYFGYAILTGIMILYWKLIQKKTLPELGFNKNVGSYVTGAVSGAVLVVISVVAIVLTGAISYNGVFRSINIGFILLMLGGFVCQGAMEEVLCRGIAMQLLRNRTSIPVAVGISSVLFMIPHLLNMSGTSGVVIFFAIINLILISIVFSLLTLLFKSIWAACGFHTIWNFILYNILGMNLSGNDRKTAAVFDMKSVGSNALNGGVYGIEASVITAVILAVTAFILLSMKNKKGGAANGVQ